MRIRESVENDKDGIRKVHQNAFGKPEGEIVSQLAVDILGDETAQPILSLVAEQNNEIIGNIIFSPVNIEGAEGVPAYILAPLAVAKDHQGKGVGARLINQGIEMLKTQGVGLVFVLGDPKYYTRTGFKAGHGFEAPYKLQHPEAWMAQALIEGVLANAQGKVRCASSLNSPEHW